MLILGRAIGSTKVGGKLICPRCQSNVIKRIDTQGDIDFYRCYAKSKLNIYTGERRVCGQAFRYLRIPYDAGVPKEDVQKRPELLYGKYAQQILDPMRSMMHKMKLNRKPRTA